MIAKFTKAGYTAEELDGFIDDKIKVLGLKDLCWAYIQSRIPEALDENKKTLCQGKWTVVIQRKN
jgi:hypothetical protein